jgi:hypothetical protein
VFSRAIIAGDLILGDDSAFAYKLYRCEASANEILSQLFGLVLR